MLKCNKVLYSVIYVGNTTINICFLSILKFVLKNSILIREEPIPYDETFLLLKQLNFKDRLLPQEKTQYNDNALDIFIKFQIISCEFCQANIVRSSLYDHQLVCEKRKFLQRKTMEYSQVNMERLYLEQQILDHAILNQLDYIKEQPKECYGLPKQNAYTAREERPIKPLSKNISQELFGEGVPQKERTLKHSQSEQILGQPLMSFENHNINNKNDEVQKFKPKKTNLKKNKKKNTKKKVKKKFIKQKSIQEQNQQKMIQDNDLIKYNSTGTQKTKKKFNKKNFIKQNFIKNSKQDSNQTKKNNLFKRKKTQSDCSQNDKSLSISKKIRENQSVQIPQHFHEKIASKMNKIEQSLRDIEVFKNSQQETRENVYNQILSKIIVTPKNKLDLMRFQNKQKRLSNYQSSPQLIQFIQN